MLLTSPRIARSALVLAGLCVGSAFSQAPSAVLNARASAVQIMVAKDGAQHAICSGSVVRFKEGPRILTAGHCTSGDLQGATFTLLDYKGHRWPMRLESKAFNWPTKDYAVFNSAAEYLLPALKVASAPLVIGDQVYSWSGPMGLGLMLFHGEVEGELHAPTDAEAESHIGSMLYASLDVAGGASGSAVMNEKGEVVSTLVGGFDPKVKLSGSYFAPLPPL